jgi:hypothetical protein
VTIEGGSKKKETRAAPGDSAIHLKLGDRGKTAMIEKTLHIMTIAGEMETFICHLPSAICHLPSRAQRTVSRYLLPGDGRHGIREELKDMARRPTKEAASSKAILGDECLRR